MNDRDLVLEANAAFYKAFSKLDLPAILDSWAQTPADTCVHPGWDALVGWDHVRESWRVIVANTDFMEISAADPVVIVTGDIARVTCTESIYTVQDGTPVHSRIIATNLFLRTPRGWRMTVHHGSSLGQTEDTSEVALA